jgi:hypothetical protein
MIEQWLNEVLKIDDDQILPRKPKGLTTELHRTPCQVYGIDMAFLNECNIPFEAAKRI